VNPMRTPVSLFRGCLSQITIVLLALFLCSPALAQKNVIRPGEPWLDDRGLAIQAHGVGILHLGDTYFWFGEDRSKDNDPARRYVACYSSTDLVHWKFRRQVLAVDEVDGIRAGLILERPKVFYNAGTGKFVMYTHLDGPGYKIARVAVFVSDTVDGEYRFVKSFRPLGLESRDIGQFIDDDGKAYLIFESRPSKGFYIASLSADSMDVDKQVAFLKAPLEGGALVHYQGMYYVVGSSLTGWRPNPNLYATAISLAGPWSEFKDIAPPATNTYGSQSTLMLKVQGKKATTVIFMGDIWKPKTQWDSRYLWMPLKIGDGKLELPTPAPWSLDVKSGKAKMLR
jgi:hypothetical protein